LRRRRIDRKDWTASGCRGGSFDAADAKCSKAEILMFGWALILWTVSLWGQPLLTGLVTDLTIDPRTSWIFFVGILVV
jgi:hypothetical protein